MPPKTPKKAPAPLPLRAEGFSYGQVRPLVQASLEVGLSVLVRGHPGIGKSALAADLAKSMGKPMVDVRLAQRDPAEVAGVFFPNRERQTLDLFAPDWVRQACDEPTFVLLDEINAAVTKLHQAAAYQIVLEHRVGPFTFHPGTVVMAAGNLEEDRAIVTTLSSALSNRFAHFVMRPDVESWLQWAAWHGIDEQVMAFVRAEGEDVLFQASTDYAFPTPRSWEMASRVMRKVVPSERKHAIAACIGLAMAERFSRYVEIYMKVPAERIIRHGHTITFANKEPSYTYAAVFCVASYLTAQEVRDEHLPHVVTFLRSPGLDPEYHMLFLRQVKARTPHLIRRLQPLEGFQRLAAELVSLKTSRYS